MSDPVVALEGVCKTYGGRRAVDNLSFAVEPFTCFGLLGPNGAGKTTTMKMVYGKSRRDRGPCGTIRVFGADPDNDELSIKYTAGVVPQENNLDEELNVYQNLHIYATFYRIGRKEQRRRIAELLEFMELTGKETARIDRKSVV